MPIICPPHAHHAGCTRVSLGKRLAVEMYLSGGGEAAQIHQHIRALAKRQRHGLLTQRVFQKSAVSTNQGICTSWLHASL